MQPPPLPGTLQEPPPRLGELEALAAGAKLFGVSADAARNLGSERDQVWLLSAAGTPVAVLKVSNSRESADVLDCEAECVVHALLVDPLLPLVRPRLPVGVTDGPARALWQHAGSSHWVRCYSVLPGRTRSCCDGPLNDDLLHSWGETSARLSLALRSFHHPAAARPGFLWDVRHASTLRPLLRHVRSDVRDMCARTLDEYERVLQPALPRLRHQFLHADLHGGNVLLRDSFPGDATISGIVDFGDATHASLVADLAATLANLANAHVGAGCPAELRRAARLLLDGYQKHSPLEAQELRLLTDAWMLRCATEVIIASWRVATGLETATRSQADTLCFAAQLTQLSALEPHQRAAFLSLPGPLPPPAQADAQLALAAMLRRRERAIGPGSEPLSYASVQLPSGACGVVVPVQGEGAYLIDASGERLLDCYNNVACCGHAHPRVAAAVSAAARGANVNQRYLSERSLSLAERLLASANAGGAGGPLALDTCFFVNSGSEANDLAWRLACAFTGAGGGMCSHWAYHGVTDATVAFSPETAAGAGHLPAHVERWAPPDAYRGTHAHAEAEWGPAHARLVGKGYRLAATILDGLLTSDGVAVLEPGYVRDIVRLTRQAGGLYIADEVQAGHGRSGEMWSYTRSGVQPDVVTLGKPTGNGYPIGVVLTRREVADALVRKTGVYFSTFGGAPMAVAAAHAVLDVLVDEGVLSRTARAGEALRVQIVAACAAYPCVGDVRGAGLMCGIEIVGDAASKRPDAERAGRVRDGLRRRGVLVGTCGEHCNVLKVRPPLAFAEADIPVFVAALVGALEESFAM